MTDNPALTRLNRIIQRDCMEELAALADESIDLTLFSPPYDGIRDYNMMVFETTKRTGRSTLSNLAPACTA